MKLRISKTIIWLLLILIVAFILRVIIAQHMDMGTDETVYSTHAIDIIEAKKLSTIHQSPVYFYLLDIVYKLFGISAFTSRLPSVIFGGLAVIIIYLLGRQFFNKKIALIASFLFAISGYALRYNAEMDMTAIFLILISILFYIKGLKANEKYLLLSSLFLGVAVLTKSIMVTIIPVYIVYYFIYSHKNPDKSLIRFGDKKIQINKRLIAMVALCILILLILSMPVVVYNYLLYKEKGYTDIVVLEFLKMDKGPYGGLAMDSSGWSPFRFSIISKIRIKSYFTSDVLIMCLSLFGIILSLKKKKEEQIKNIGLLYLLILLPFIYLLGVINDSFHYVLFSPFFCLFAAFSIDHIYEKIKNKMKINGKKILLVLLGIIFVVNLFLLSDRLTEKSATNELRKFVSSIPDNSLVIVDSRIYRGRIAWMFNDKHYLESNYMSNLLNKMNELPGELIVMPIYFVECVTDNCGWSTISPAIQELSEDVVTFFKDTSTKVAEIKGNKHSFDIYKTDSEIKLNALDLADNTHQFFYYPVRWRAKEEDIFDYYSTKTIFDKFLNAIAYIILYMSILIVILSPILLIYYLFKKGL